MEARISRGGGGGGGSGRSQKVAEYADACVEFPESQYAFPDALIQITV